ncbi:hypothetical protein CSA37_05115 [Candidatus Fermentibacteria bacterium]|nr:MAG: hypothetical protein CSA37_05115 [Candidatus Fermentibacteria bacterium]
MSAWSVSLLLLVFAAGVQAEETNLPGIAVIPVFNDQEFSREELVSAAEAVYANCGRFRVVDVSEHELYVWNHEEQTSNIQIIAADMSVDMFMLLDVSARVPEMIPGMGDSLFAATRAGLDLTGRFYSSSGTLLGSIRESRSWQSSSGSTSSDMYRQAENGVTRVAERSLIEIFPYEFSFVAEGGPQVTMPVGTSGGIRRGMIFSLVARSTGIPRSSQEYRALGSHGLLQITGVSASESTGRLISGHIVEGASLTAVENSSPAMIGVSYAALPTEVEPGEGLSGEEAETSRVLNQAEFTGATAKWGFTLGGGIFSGVLPRMASIGIRGEIGTRIPLVTPKLALRATVGFEASLLSQNTRADSITSTATAGSFAGTGALNLEWLISGRFGVYTGARGRIGTTADRWSVKSWTGYNRDAYDNEVYYSEVRQSAVSFAAGLTYLLF